MNRRMAPTLWFFLLISAFAVPVSGAETITNADVVEMTRAGLAPDVVVAKINASPSSFDLSTSAILQLSGNGVHDQVIKAMLDSGAARPSAAPGSAAAADGERVRAELAELAAGAPEAREAALAWFIANRDAVTPDLRSFLSEANPENRAAAALALGRIGDAGSVGQIRNLLTDPDPEARRSAAQALSLLGDQPAVMAAEQAIQRGVNPIDGSIRLIGHAKLTRMSARLGEILVADREAVNRSAAAWALGEIGRAGVAGRPALERALSFDAEPGVRREAALAIAKFNDSAAAASLQNACSLDPAVRKTTLTALAEYPEAVEFLIGVLGLPADQIAIDETEAARTSLARLTGQDFGLDGQRWREWYGSNGARVAAPASPPSAMPVELDGLAIFDPAVAAPQFETARVRTERVDPLEAWSIVADSAVIPTAPLPGEAAAAPLWGGTVGEAAMPAGISGSGPGGGPAWSGRSGEELPSWSGVSAAPAGAAGISAAAPLSPGGQAVFPSSVPTVIPDVDIPESERAGGRTAAGGSSAPGTSGLRTWSSDPERLVRGGAPAEENDADVPGWTPILQDMRSAFAQPPGEPGGQADDPPGSLSADTVFIPPPASPFSPSPSAAVQGSADLGDVSAPPSLFGDDEPFFPPPGQAAAGDDGSRSSGSGTSGFGDGGPVPDPNPYADLSDILGGRLPPGGAEDADAAAFDRIPRPDSDEPWSIASDASVPAVPAEPEAGGENSIAPDPYAGWSETPSEPDSPLEAAMPGAGVLSAQDDPYAEWSAGLPAEDSSAVESPQEAATPAAPSEPALPTPIAAEEPPAGRESGTIVFVDPEPGQLVITDDFPQGRVMTDMPQPSAVMPAPDAVPPPLMDETPSSPPGGGAAEAEPAPADAPAQEAEAGSGIAASPAESPTPAAPFRSSSPVAAEPPPPDQSQDASGGPQTQYLAPPPRTSGDGSPGFMDPSSPLPPVRPEGTVTAPSGKGVPLLGEGFF